MNNSKKQKTISSRQEKQKTSFVTSLEKYPIVKVACDKSGVSKATYYRWRDEDESFRDKADQAILHGEEFLNDMAEHQMITLIKDKHFPAIRFWLERRHPMFNTSKVEHSGHIGIDFDFDQEQ